MDDRGKFIAFCSSDPINQIKQAEDRPTFDTRVSVDFSPMLNVWQTGSRIIDIIVRNINALNYSFYYITVPFVIRGGFDFKSVLFSIRWEEYLEDMIVMKIYSLYN